MRVQERVTRPKLLITGLASTDWILQITQQAVYLWAHYVWAHYVWAHLCMGSLYMGSLCMGSLCMGSLYLGHSVYGLTMYGLTIYEKVLASIPWYNFSWEILPGLCSACFAVLFCSVGSAADTHLKLLDRVVSGVRFLTGGVYEYNIAHRDRFCMLCKIRCNLMHPLNGTCDV